MTIGQLLTIVSDGDIVIQRTLVSVENGVFFVCKPEEFEKAIREGRTPVCIGFEPEYIVDLKGGNLRP
jgi:hypothetical protein